MLFQFEGEASVALANFNTDFERYVRVKLGGRYPAACDELKHRVNRLFLAAVIRHIFNQLPDDHHKHLKRDDLLNIDAHGAITDFHDNRLNFRSYSTAVFPLAQSSLREGAYYYEAGTAGALFIAAGDALVNPHPHSGIGITMARSELDNIAKILHERYQQGQHGDLTQSHHLVEGLREVQSEATKQVLEAGKSHIKSLSEERERNALEQMCAHVDALARGSIARSNEGLKKYDFRVHWDQHHKAEDRVSEAKKRFFNLKIHHLVGDFVMCSRITDEARVELMHPGMCDSHTGLPTATTRSFETVLQAAVHAQNNA